MHEDVKNRSVHKMKGKNVVKCLEDTLISLKFFDMDGEQTVEITLSEFGIYIEDNRGCSLNRPLSDLVYEN
jgi:hypothetical protein